MTASPIAVFLHGAPGRGADWDGVVAHAPAGWRCLAPTLPDNVDDAPGTDLAAHERLVERALDDAAGPVTLVGQSLGGWLAARFAEHRAVRRLVLVANTDVTRPELHAGVSGMVRALEDTPASGPAVAAAVLAGWVPDEGAPERAAVAAFLSGLPAARLARAGRRILEAAQRPALSFGWRTQTTLVHAADDGTAPLAWSQALAARLPSARLVTLDRGGHVPHLLEPRRVAAEVFA